MDMTPAAGHVLSVDPPIRYSRPRPAPFGLAGMMAPRAINRAMTAIIQTMWTLEREQPLSEIVILARAFRRRYPLLTVIIAANTAKELELLHLNGVSAVLANHNIFVDSYWFRPAPAVHPRYDAIYNAKFSAFKRRELCAELPNCAHIGYLSNNPAKADPVTRFRATAAALPQHEFLNPVSGTTVKRLEPAQVNRALAQAHVGLCLSAEEGAMIASMEYLLAGVPVVTTPSLGGRDRYFTPETSITAEDNPRAIREAVEALKARNIPRNVVRRKTLQLLNRDRAQFNAFVDGLRGGKAAVSNDPRWSFDYTANLFGWGTAGEFAALLGLPSGPLAQSIGSQELMDGALLDEDLAPVRMG